MAMLPGVSFSPINDASQPGHAGPQGSPLQDAIKILSFRMPTVVGAQMSAGSPLAGNLGDSVADDWLLKLFRGLLPTGPAPGAPAAPPPPSAPPAWTGAPAGPSAPPVWTGAPPPGPSPTAPPPNVVFTPPESPKLPAPPPSAPSPPPDRVPGPPEWRDWLR